MLFPLGESGNGGADLSGKLDGHGGNHFGGARGGEVEGGMFSKGNIGNVEEVADDFAFGLGVFAGQGGELGDVTKNGNGTGVVKMHGNRSNCMGVGDSMGAV